MKGGVAGILRGREGTREGSGANEPARPPARPLRIASLRLAAGSVGLQAPLCLGRPQPSSGFEREPPAGEKNRTQNGLLIPFIFNLICLFNLSAFPVNGFCFPLPTSAKISKRARSWKRKVKTHRSLGINVQPIFLPLGFFILLLLLLKDVWEGFPKVYFYLFIYFYHHHKSGACPPRWVSQPSVSSTIVSDLLGL